MEQVTSAFRAMLFDCDGVLQRPSNDWRTELAGLLDTRDEVAVATFFEDVRLAEAPTMDGSQDFAERLQDVLDRWQVSAPVAEVLPIWQQLAVDPQMLAAARELRASGLFCALATNQHTQRAAYMRRELRYERDFDPCFYSCEIGVAKPDPAYFVLAVDRLGLEPHQVLFIDDVLANVEGARSAGLIAEHFARDAGRAELDRILALHGLTEPLAA